MRIEELDLRNYRNYTELRLQPDAGINLLYGQNGSGKTNLLEAIHYCALGRSHRVSNDTLAVKKESDFARIRLTVRNMLGLREIAVRFQPTEAQKKSVYLDQKRAARFSDMMGCLRCVMFSPEDLGMIKEGPSLRRRFLDMMISQVHRGYFIALQQYKTGLDQRNAILRNLKTGNTAGLSMLDSFEAAMAEPASVIIQERKRMCEMLRETAGEMYGRISGTREEFSVRYQSSLKDAEDIRETLKKAYRENREEDIRMGATCTGPHRDDLLLTLNRNPMKHFASQGQIRTAALSLRLSQMHILSTVSGESPVLLLDDVMSELDRNRRESLIREIQGCQTFITCADQNDISFENIQKCFEVSASEGEGRVTLRENVSRETLEA